MSDIKELAAQAFDASERVRVLMMMNTPLDYDKRKAAFIQLAEAQEAEAKAAAMLEGAIKAAQLIAARTPAEQTDCDSGCNI
jgi:hypothetical protein